MRGEGFSEQLLCGLPHGTASGFFCEAGVIPLAFARTQAIDEDILISGVLLFPFEVLRQGPGYLLTP